MDGRDPLSGISAYSRAPQPAWRSGEGCREGRAPGSCQEERTHGHAPPLCSSPVTPGLQSGSARAGRGGPRGGCSKAVPAALGPAQEEGRGMRSSRRSRECPPRSGLGTGPAGTLTGEVMWGFRVRHGGVAVTPSRSGSSGGRLCSHRGVDPKIQPSPMNLVSLLPPREQGKPQLSPKSSPAP